MQPSVRSGVVQEALARETGCAGFISIEMEKYPSWLNATAFAFNTLTPLVIIFYAWAIYEGTFKDSSEDMFGNMTSWPIRIPPLVKA